MLAATAIGPMARMARMTWALSSIGDIAVDVKPTCRSSPEPFVPRIEGIWPGGLPAFGQHPVQRVDVEVGAVDVNAQRWLGLQDVLVVAGGLDDHAQFEHAVADRRGLRRRRRQRFPV